MTILNMFFLCSLNKKENENILVAKVQIKFSLKLQNKEKNFLCINNEIYSNYLNNEDFPFSKGLRSDLI